MKEALAPACGSMVNCLRSTRRLLKPDPNSGRAFREGALVLLINSTARRKKSEFSSAGKKRPICLRVLSCPSRAEISPNGNF